MLKKLTPNLMVEDVNLAIDFYKDILGFELIMTVPEEGKFDWAMMRNGNVEIMCQTRSSLAEGIPEFKEMEGGGALTIYMEMEGVEDLYARVKGNVEITEELHETFYGMKEFSMRDRDGFILAFAERL